MDPRADCLGPPLTVSADLVGGGTTTMYPFAACENPMRAVSLVVRNSLLLGFWMGSGFVALKIVAAAFGWTLPNSWGSRADR